MGLASTYAKSASPPTPRLAISITPATSGAISVVSALTTGAGAGGASAGGGSGIASSTATGAGAGGGVGVGVGVDGSNLVRSAGGPGGVGLWW